MTEKRQVIQLADGRLIGTRGQTIFRFDGRPPERIPTGFDPASERQGCCDPPPDQSR